MTRLGRVAVVVATLAIGLGAGASTAAAAPGDLPFDAGAGQVTVAGGRLVDAHGREVVLRGFNVSGSTKLSETRGLPFRSVADAERSAAAMRRLTTANSVRFLLSWAYAEPSPGRVDPAYLEAATGQLRAFLRQGFRVLPDFHQDLYSRHLFDEGSWYTGDGAPQWVIAAGGYPREFCGICVQWGQNFTQNAAVQQASRDFWHNRVLTTPAGRVGVQDAFLRTAGVVLRHLRQNLAADEWPRIAGFDPLNEPYAGLYTEGENAESWERDRLWPFYQRFRQVMDDAGWADRPAYVEPNLFWHSNISFSQQGGGFRGLSGFGPRYVFNAHFYDHAALSGVFKWGRANDGEYAGDHAEIRARAAELGTAAAVTEFGHKITGYTSDKMPTVLKAIYQGLDSGLPGATWWRDAARAGAPLSGMQWQWDTASGRHSEPMNGNPSKILTAGDAWNDEDFSAVRLDDAGRAVLRQDVRLLDRVYPSAVAGRTLAFVTEDRSRDGSATLSWTPVPASMPAVRTLVGSAPYAVLVWRSTGGSVPTELRLPASFPAAGTTVVSDLGQVTAIPAHDGSRPVSASPDGRRLLLTAPAGLHYALVVPGGSGSVLPAARAELDAWVVSAGFR